MNWGPFDLSVVFCCIIASELLLLKFLVNCQWKTSREHLWYLFGAHCTTENFQIIHIRKGRHWLLIHCFERAVSELVVIVQFTYSVFFHRQGLKFKMQTKVTTAERTGGAIKVNIETLKDGKQSSVSLGVHRNLFSEVLLNCLKNWSYITSGRTI